MKIIQSKNIKDFRPLIDSLIPDFGPIFLYTILQWCELADDTSKDDNQFWEVYLIQEKNKTIGICGLYSLPPHSTEELWLGWFGIVPELRNKGIGKDIMKHLYKQAKLNNCKRILSYVDKDGKPLNFYKREGFEVVGTVETFLKENNIRQIDGDEFESPEDFVIKKEL